MIKQLIFILLFVFSTSVMSQMNRFNGRQNIQPRTPMASPKQQFPEVNVEKAVGMTFYKTEKLIKKIGVKKSSKTFSLVTNIFKKFNKDLKQVKRINSFLFSEGKLKIENARKQSFKTGDYSIIQKATKEVTTIFEPVVKVIEEKETNLDNTLKEILTIKQFKKWIKYKTNIKKK